MSVAPDQPGACSRSKSYKNEGRIGVKVQGILFDLDGTLLDTEQLLLESFRYATKKVLGQVIPDAKLMAKVGQPLDTQMWDFTDDPVVREELSRVYREYNAAVHDELIRIFPGVSETLKELRARGYALGVVTSKRHDVALRGLQTFGLESALDCFIGSDDWPTHKPDPGPVAHGCDLLGLPAASCMYVGDSPFDMLAGNGAGCFTVAALWGMFPQDVLAVQKPDTMCENIGDLLGVLSS